MWQQNASMIQTSFKVSSSSTTNGKMKLEQVVLKREKKIKEKEENGGDQGQKKALKIRDKQGVYFERLCMEVRGLVLLQLFPL